MLAVYVFAGSTFFKRYSRFKVLGYKYVCMYLHMLSRDVCDGVLSVCMYIYKYGCVHIYVYTYIFVYIYMCTYVNINVYIYMYTYIYIYTYLHEHK